jgi:hypothetical protein
VIGARGIARVTVNCPAAQRRSTLTLECFEFSFAGSQFQRSFTSFELFQFFDALPSPRQIVGRGLGGNSWELLELLRMRRRQVIGG